jgi:hypothetical protein
LLGLLEHACGPLPKTLRDEILNCDDLGRLHAAVLQTRTLTSLDQFRL